MAQLGARYRASLSVNGTSATSQRDGYVRLRGQSGRGADIVRGPSLIRSRPDERLPRSPALCQRQPLARLSSGPSGRKLTSSPRLGLDDVAPQQESKYESVRD
jgi:hypothetical protein